MVDVRYWHFLLGTGLGLGLCTIIGQIAVQADYPFRMMWFTPADRVRDGGSSEYRSRCDQRSTRTEA
jgi:hypothetical protein